MSIELKQEVIDLAAELKKGIKITHKDSMGVATPEENVYVKTLPEGLTEATVKAVAKHHSNLIAASGLALGELSLPLMKKEDELQKVMMTIPGVGGDKVEVQFERSKMTGAPGAEKTEKLGALSASYEMRGARSVGQLAGVKQHLANLAAETLNHKKK